MKISSINPANGKTLAEYTLHTTEQVHEKIEQVHAAWGQWKQTSHADRALLLKNLAAILRRRSEEFAQLMANEMGKPIQQGRAEVEKCAVCCEYYAAHAEEQLSDQPVKTEASKSFITFQPIGVVLAVMPWNFPFWQVIRFLAPTLAAGNCGVLKHASNVPGCALALEEIVEQAGFPKYVFQTLLINSKMVNDVIDHPYIKAVTLTGSNKAGEEVAKKAGSVVKKCVLELGGSDGYIVLADADLELAATTCANSRLINSGQSCIAAKRFIVEAAVLEKFTELLIEKMRPKRMGNPLLEETEIGPQARAELKDEIHEQVQQSIKKGAVCLLGGQPEPGAHAFYPVTILTNVTPGMPAYDEEVFGPVAAIISAKDEADAIRIANDTIFGLGSAIFTRDTKKGEQIARNELQAGSCFVNSLVQSDPRLPFGGIKSSGFGRELSSYGIHEFVNIKTVSIA